MVKKLVIKQDMYYDSVTLMLVSKQMSTIEGIQETILAMATPHNLELIKSMGLLEEERKLTQKDLIIAVIAKNDELAEQVIETALKHLKSKKAISNSEYKIRSIDAAYQSLTGANLVLISIPGIYAFHEANKALDKGLHVMLFSDNVSIQEEKKLKEKAVEKGLLMMGPDCGTAIINGAPLAFANVIKKGRIGIVAASGTGAQEVSTIINNIGEGISQLIGTGGRDLKEEIGGLMIFQALDALEADLETEVIVLISKPPALSIMDKLLSKIREISIKKPIVVHLLGSSIKEEGNIYSGNDLEETAIKSVAILRGTKPENISFGDDISFKATAEAKKLSSEQKYIRALYTGGTLCDETMFLLKDYIEFYSNIPLKESLKLKNSNISYKHTAIDFGEDEFTRGKPHPMIDPFLREKRILIEAEDKETAVVLMDIVLGYGSHNDPAGAMADDIIKAKAIAHNQGRYLSVICSICGTSGDPQGYKYQKKILEDSGAIVTNSNARAARLALSIIKNIA